jgi:hypothetical protein
MVIYTRLVDSLAPGVYKLLLNVRFSCGRPTPRISVAGPDEETHHSVVLKLDQVDQSGSAAGWHSVVPARGRGAGLAGVYIGYSVVPVWYSWFYIEMVIMERRVD